MTNKPCFVFAYVNPDTDGVCSSIGYAFLKSATTQINYLPVAFGALNNETLFVLNHFRVTTPIINPEIPQDSQIAIVDTHHINQLPLNIPLQNVVEVIDHHPAGNPEAFPNAIIQNENIGAVATLIAEKLKANNIIPENKIAGLLIAAIISNTVNFSAPSTTNRDKESVNWLQRFSPISQHFVENLFSSREELTSKPIKEILLSDYKEFQFGGLSFGISQVETTNTQNILTRPDLLTSLAQIQVDKSLDHVFLNVIDLVEKTSVIVSHNFDTQQILSQTIGADFNKSLARFERILLRKTDLIPALQAKFF